MESYDIFVPQITVDSKYSVSGAECQVLSIALKPGESVQSEPGAMMMMSPSIKTDVNCGAPTRCCTGETCCVTPFENKGKEDGFVSLTPNFPAKVVPLHLPSVNKVFIAKNGSFMSSVGKAEVSVDCDCNPITGCFGGLGCCRQKTEGDGTVFYTAGGTVLQKTLAAGEKVVVDAGSIVGFEKSVTFGVKPTGACCTCCFAGEGLCYGTLEGPGLVMVQSMSFEKYLNAVAPAYKAQNGQAADNAD